MWARKCNFLANQLSFVWTAELISQTHGKKLIAWQVVSSFVWFMCVTRKVHVLQCHWSHFPGRALVPFSCLREQWYRNQVGVAEQQYVENEWIRWQKKRRRRKKSDETKMWRFEKLRRGNHPRSSRSDALMAEPYAEAKSLSKKRRIISC